MNIIWASPVANGGYERPLTGSPVHRADQPMQELKAGVGHGYQNCKNPSYRIISTEMCHCQNMVSFFQYTLQETTQKKHRLKTKHSKMLWMMEQSYNFQVSKCSTYWGVLALDRSSTLEPCSGQIMATEQAWGTNVPTKIRYLLPDTMWDLYNLNYESSSRFVVSYWFE